MPQYRPLVNEAQKEIWGDVPFPPRSIVEVTRLNQVSTDHSRSAHPVLNEIL